MGGSVSVKSRVGEGTTFTITLNTMCDGNLDVKIPYDDQILNE